jgi:hypothetical protein
MAEETPNSTFAKIIGPFIAWALVPGIKAE